MVWPARLVVRRPLSESSSRHLGLVRANTRRRPAAGVKMMARAAPNWAAPVTKLRGPLRRARRSAGRFNLDAKKSPDKSRSRSARAPRQVSVLCGALVSPAARRRLNYIEKIIKGSASSGCGGGGGGSGILQFTQPAAARNWTHFGRAAEVSFRRGRPEGIGARAGSAGASRRRPERKLGARFQLQGLCLRSGRPRQMARRWACWR